MRGGKRRPTARQHDAVEERKLQRGRGEALGSGPVTTISAARSRRSSALSSATWTNRFCAATGSTPSNNRSACVAPGVVAGQRRQPHQVLRGERVRVGRGVVGGGGRPHHQAFGVVGGEEIAAGVGIGVVPIERAAARPAPDRDRRARRSPRAAPARRGSWRQNRRRGRETAAVLRARNGRAGRRWSSCAAMKAKARCGHARSSPARRSSDAGVDQRGDHQPVPVGQDLVVEARAARACSRTVKQLVAQRREPRFVLLAAR